MAADRGCLRLRWGSEDRHYGAAVGPERRVGSSAAGVFVFPSPGEPRRWPEGHRAGGGLVTFALCRAGWWEPSTGSAVAGSRRGQPQNGSEASQVAGRGRGVSSGRREGLEGCSPSRVRMDFQAVPTHVRVGGWGAWREPEHRGESSCGVSWPGHQLYFVGRMFI